MHRASIDMVLVVACAAAPAVAGDACLPPRLLVGADIGTLDRIEAHEWPSGGILNHYVGAGLVNLRNPGALIEGPDGLVYVASTSSNEVFRFDRRTGRPMDGGGAFIDSASGNLSAPYGLAFDADGRLYVANGNGRVRWFDSSGQSLGEFAGNSGWGTLAEMVVTEDGAILVASFSGNRIYRIESDRSLYGGDGILVANGDDAPVRPLGMTIGDDGLLYVCSRDTNDVRRYDPSDGSPVDPGAVFIEPGVGGLDAPVDLQFVPGGRLLVSSFATDRVIEFDAATGLSLGLFASVSNPETLLLVFDDGPVDGCPSDLSEDGRVGFDDLLELLTDWGDCP